MRTSNNLDWKKKSTFFSSPRTEPACYLLHPPHFPPPSTYKRAKGGKRSKRAKKARGLVLKNLRFFFDSGPILWSVRGELVSLRSYSKELASEIGLTKLMEVIYVQ